MIEIPDLAFTIELDTAKKVIDKASYGFELKDIPSLVTRFKKEFQFVSIDK
jgi:hypothetical protein